MAGNRRGRRSSPLSPPPSPPIPPTLNPRRQGSRVRSTDRRSQAERDVDAVFERDRLSREANATLRRELKRRLLRLLLLLKRRLLHSEQRTKKLRLKQERLQGRTNSRLIRI